MFLRLGVNPTPVAHTHTQTHTHLCTDKRCKLKCAANFFLAGPLQRSTVIVHQAGVGWLDKSAVCGI